MDLLIAMNSLALSMGINTFLFHKVELLPLIQVPPKICSSTSIMEGSSTIVQRSISNHSVLNPQQMAFEVVTIQAKAKMKTNRVIRCFHSRWHQNHVYIVVMNWSRTKFLTSEPSSHLPTYNHQLNKATWAIHPILVRMATHSSLLNPECRNRVPNESFKRVLNGTHL